MSPIHVFVLTGAGVSAESGLGTFRDADGVWTRVDLMEVATPQGFAHNPAKVLAFYNARDRALPGAKPNPAHFALARLQAHLAARGGALTLCTQNVDDLHEKAGATDVIHMHGELSKWRCDGCGTLGAYEIDLVVNQRCAACGELGAIRPHVVWFGEYPLEFDRIGAALAACTHFVAVGTSGAVYPAAGFVAEARRRGAPTLEINLAPSDVAQAFDAGRYGPAGEVVPAWVDELIAAAA